MAKKSPKTSALENKMAGILDEARIPYTREYKAIPGRRFRWDFAIGSDPEKTRLLIEVQGGTWSRKPGGHNTGAGIKRDAEKLNLAVSQGWRCLLFTSDMVRSTTNPVIDIVQEMYGATDG